MTTIHLQDEHRKISLVFVLVVFVLLVLFLLREFGCWFSKINHVLSVVRENREMLKAMQAAAV